MRILLVAAVAIGCSRPRDREREALAMALDARTFARKGSCTGDHLFTFAASQYSEPGIVQMPVTTTATSNDA